jgi:hypothetical protein
VAAAVALAVCVWDSSAFAINALVSQDLPILSQIAMTEAASYTELGAILGEMAVLVAQAKEYTSVAKTAWGALDELRHMSSRDLLDAAALGARGAFPELDGMYGDIQDMRDLNYRDYRAVATLRGMLWDEVYGPAIDYLHTGHENLEALASHADLRGRHSAKLAARRAEAEQWAEDCRRTSSAGEGACQAAASRAEIQQALALADLHESNLHLLDTAERQLKREERREADTVYAFERWLYDLNAYMAATSGDSGTCIAGQCLYAQYGTKMEQRLRAHRASHPRSGAPRVGSGAAEPGSED